MVKGVSFFWVTSFTSSKGRILSIDGADDPYEPNNTASGNIGIVGRFPKYRMVVEEGTGNGAAEDGMTDNTDNNGTASGALGNGVRDLGDGVGDAVKDQKRRSTKIRRRQQNVF